MKKDEIIPDTEAIRWETIGQNGERADPTKVTIASSPREADGRTVCDIKTESGATEEVEISHLDAITPGSVMAAQLQGLNLGPGALSRSTKKFFNDRGVNVTIEGEGEE